MARAGPAGTWTTSTPGWSCTTSGRPRASRRVNTSTVWPRSARAEASAATWTFCPPASSPPSTAGEPGGDQLLDALGLHPVDVHGHRPGDPGGEVGAGDAGAAHRFVARERER